MQQSAQPSSAKNYLLDIWTQPRAVVREIIDTDPGKHMLPITLIAGAVIGLESGIFGVALSALLALVILFLSAFLLRWVGSWFGGQGTVEALRAATVWGYYLPRLQWQIVLVILNALSSVLTSTITNSTLLLLADFIPLVFMTVMTIWSLTIYIRAVAEAHQFTIGKAILTTLLVAAISVAPFIIAFLALGGLG